MRTFIKSDRSHYYGTKYVVELNDNLYDIARRFHTTVDELKKMNHLASNLIQPGQILIVDNIYDPKSVYFYDRYIVKEGESIYSIAYKFGMTTDQLTDINNILSDNIKPGEILYVFNVNKLLDENIYYTVQPGDSLYSISQKFHCDVKEIIELNNLQSNKLTVGSELLVLTKEMIAKIRENSNVYFVKPEDNLFTIAKKTGTTVERLKAINKLSSDKLSIGQKLLIPLEQLKNTG